MNIYHNFDLGFSIVAELKQDIVFVFVYEIMYFSDTILLWKRKDDDIRALGAETDDLDEARVYLGGVLNKYNCSTWQFTEPLHFCSPADAITIGPLFEYLYEISNELMARDGK